LSNVPSRRKQEGNTRKKVGCKERRATFKYKKGCVQKEKGKGGLFFGLWGKEESKNKGGVEEKKGRGFGGLFPGKGPGNLNCSEGFPKGLGGGERNFLEEKKGVRYNSHLSWGRKKGENKRHKRKKMKSDRE